MGSCLGTNSASPPPKTPTSADGGSKSPPPVYEETVKEVLSETPAAPKHPIPTFHRRQTMPHQTKNAFNSGLKREKAAEVSPVRKSDASPGRAKPGRGRSRSPMARSDSGSSKTGLDTSRSPVKTGYHPGRVEYGIRKGREEERMPPTNIELLESSLVSLECFIFL